MVVGALLGWLNPGLAISLKPLSTIFLRMIKSVVVPLIFGSLVIGIAGHGDDMKRVGRLALKSIIYFEIVTTVAPVRGTGGGEPDSARGGVQLRRSIAGGTGAGAEDADPERDPGAHRAPELLRGGSQQRSAPDRVLLHSLRGGSHSSAGTAKETMLGFCEGLAETMFKFTGIVMKYAPIGVGRGDRD